MSAHSYVSCLVHRGVVPREDAVCVDDYERIAARRRHVCHRCIIGLAHAKTEHSRSLALASWRATIRASAGNGTNPAGGR